MERKIKVSGKQAGRLKQLVDDLKEMKACKEL
jgi:hypothetical protein